MRHFLFHLGSIPPHLKYCISNIIKYNNTVVLCTDQEITVDNVNVEVVNVKTFKQPAVGDFFSSESNLLWLTSLLRIHYLNEYVQSLDINEPVVHFDNDVVCFYDVNELKNKLEREIYITPHKESEYTFGFSIINNKKKMNELTSRVFDIVRKGEREARRLTGDEIHEMRLLGYVDNQLIRKLPVFPGDENSFGYLFDPSSYGQFIDGTPNGHAPGFIDKQQYIGSKLDSSCNILYINKPYLYRDGKKYKIFNLHIHTKNLSKFTSDED